MSILEHKLILVPFLGTLLKVRLPEFVGNLSALLLVPEILVTLDFNHGVDPLLLFQQLRVLVLVLD